MPRRDSGPLPPQDLVAEEYVLGACMLASYAIEAVTEILVPADFYRESHGRIYQAIIDLHAAGEPADALTVAGRLEATGQMWDDGRERLREIATLAPVTGSAAHHARLVRTAAGRRALIRAGAEITQLGWDLETDLTEAMTTVERVAFDLQQRGHDQRGGLVHAQVIADETMRLMAELQASGRKTVGIPTGFRRIDQITSGLRPANLVLLAGRPAIGKSALGLCIAANLVIRHDPPVPVALFSLEMSKVELMQRMIASEAQVDSMKVQNPVKLDREEYGRVTAAAGRLAASPFWVDESGAQTMTAIRTAARRHKLRHPDLGLIIVDYIQLMTSGTRADNRNAELSQISRAFKQLAVELNIPVLVLSQLSRDVEHRHDKRPILSDLRDSGALEADADLVMFVYREEYYFPEMMEVQGVAEIIISKQRNGPVGTRKIAFVKQFARFSDLSKRDDETPA